MGTPQRQHTRPAPEELPALVWHLSREPATGDVELDQPHVCLLVGRADVCPISMLMYIGIGNP